MTRAFSSEWLLLNRRTMWLVALSVAVVFSATATTLIVMDEAPRLSQVGAGGATSATVRALSFGSVLTAAAFVSLVGNEFTRGTFRAALLHQPNRLALVGGKLLARMGVTAVLLFAALVTGIVTSALVAPTQDVSTTNWFGLEGLQATGEDFARLLGWGLGWALIATTIAVLVRSTPVALGIVILWFGPIENVIGDDLEFAQRWFPGQVLQSFLNPAAPDAIATSTASWTLGIYGAIMIAALTTVLMKRDVSS